MYYQRQSFGFGLTNGIKNLLYANGLFFLLLFLPLVPLGLSELLEQYFVLYHPSQVRPNVPDFKIWQLVTYMFLHGGILHILFNMFMLWMFGTELEREWGTKEFLK